MLTLDLSYAEACKILGVRNLAALQLKPEWVRIEEQRYHLVHEIRYSELSDRWALFCHWAKSRKQEDFNHLVAEWCCQSRSYIEDPNASRPSAISASTKTDSSVSDAFPQSNQVLEAVSDHSHSLSKKRPYQADDNAEHGYPQTVPSSIMNSHKRQHQAEGGMIDCGFIGTQQLRLSAGPVDITIADPITETCESPQINDPFEETASMTAHQTPGTEYLATDWTWGTHEPLQPVISDIYELGLWDIGHDLEDVRNNIIQSELAC